MSVNFLLTGLSTNEKRLDLLIKAFNMTYGAGDGTRTRDLLITSQLLYQLSYAGKMAIQKGLEPSTSSVTG